MLEEEIYIASLSILYDTIKPTRKEDRANSFSISVLVSLITSRISPALSLDFYDQCKKSYR